MLFRCKRTSLGLHVKIVLFGNQCALGCGLRAAVCCRGISWQNGHTAHWNLLCLRHVVGDRCWNLFVYSHVHLLLYLFVKYTFFWSIYKTKWLHNFKDLYSKDWEELFNNAPDYNFINFINRHDPYFEGLGTDEGHQGSTHRAAQCVPSWWIGEAPSLGVIRS